MNILRPIARGFKDLTLNRKNLALTLAAVTLVVYLAGLFLLMLNAVNAELGRERGEALFQIYWAVDAPPEQINAQWTALKNLPNLVEIKTFTPEQGLSELARNLKNEDMSWLKADNPIPHTALVSFDPPADNATAWVEEMIKSLREQPGVAKVSVNRVNNDLRQAWASFSHKVIWPVIIFLGLVLGLIVGNTIKLSLLHRQNEVEIYRLVGARQWFIVMPLLVNGAVQALTGGLLALGLLKLTQLSLSDLLNFPPLSLRLEFLPPSQALLLLLIPALVGLLSSWLVSRN